MYKIASTYLTKNDLDSLANQINSSDGKIEFATATGGRLVVIYTVMHPDCHVMT